MTVTAQVIEDEFDEYEGKKTRRLALIDQDPKNRMLASFRASVPADDKVLGGTQSDLRGLVIEFAVTGINQWKDKTLGFRVNPLRIVGTMAFTPVPEKKAA